MAELDNSLETKHLGRLMGKYCIPCIIALLVATLYNIVDQLFIANASYLGSYGVAANSVVFPLTVVALGVAMLLGDGCCAFVSICLGARRTDEARRSVGTAVITLIVSGVFLMVIYLAFQEQILTLFGARVDEETFRLSKEYFFWISLGIPFYMFGQALNPIVRSDGSPRFAMVTLVIGAVINLVLDPLFIFGFKWGMMGAAVATILGQFVSALMFAGYLFRMKMVKLDRDAFRFRFGLLKKMLPLGLASLMTQISIALSMAVVLSMLEKYGAQDPVFGQDGFRQIPTAVFGIVIKIYQVVISIAIGLATGCIPIAGYNVGAKQHDRVRQLMWRLLAAEAVVGLIASVVFLLFPRPVSYLFGGANESAEYIEFSVKCIRIFMCMSVLSCINKGAAIFQQAIGNGKTATLLSILREIVFGISLPLILPMFLGLDGILYFMPVADVVAFVVSAAVVAATAKALRAAAAAKE